MPNKKFLLGTLALVLCLFVQISNADTFPQSVISYMATRNMRYHHYMWHQIRDNWDRFSSSVQKEFKSIGWAPPNPSKDRNGNRITNNYAGEDFLYMHRHMIGTAKQVATQNGQSTSMISGWTSIPAPGDKSYPVPASYPGSSSSYRTDSYYQKLANEEKQLKDPSKLRKMTLNELGTTIEGGIHNSMHMRWSAACSVGYRGGGSADDGVPNINKKWDNVKYNWLVDTYASQVNPIFWKLHGWIDDRINDWMNANGLKSITWHGTWIGGPMSNLGVLKVANDEVGAMDTMNEDPDALGDVLEKAFQIFAKSGVPESTLEDTTITPTPQKLVTKRVCKRNLKK